MHKLNKKAGFCILWVFINISSLSWAGTREGGFKSTSPLKAGLQAIWSAAGSRLDLKTWTRSELLSLKKTVTREKDAQGKMVKWDGVLISRLVDDVLNSLPVESRAQVDLIILRNRKGVSGYIPRALIGKYPLLLAYQSDPPMDRDSIQSVVPWSSKPKILNEDLPLESYFISDVSQIELTNYRDRFSSFFLKRRTDPSAIRGEKIFVQNCVTCHREVQSSPLLTTLRQMNSADVRKSLADQKHPVGPFAAKLSDRDRRSIVRYLEAHHQENPVASAVPLKSVSESRVVNGSSVTQ